MKMNKMKKMMPPSSTGIGTPWLKIEEAKVQESKDKIAADKIELETVIKTSTSSLQAEMLAMAQSFKGIMAECAATVAADSKSQIAQAVSQAVKDNDGGGRRNRGDDRCRNNRRNDDKRDDNRSPGELF